LRNIIFGPPGTGKTTHLLRIVEKELKENKVSPDKIAYLAFTNQAADEALSRAISQLNYSTKDFMNFRTLHSLAYRELHLKEDNIMSDEDYRIISDKLQINLSNPNKNIERYGAGFPDDIFMKVIDGAKIRGLTTENFFNNASTGHLQGGWLKLKYIDEALFKYKETRNKFDLTDLIVQFNKKHYDTIPKFDVVIIDYINILRDIRNPNTEQTYIKIKNIAEDLRAFAQKNDVVVISATQTNRGGFDSTEVTMANIAESAGLAHTADNIMAIIQDSEMNLNKEYWLKLIKVRDGAGKHTKCLLNIDYDYMILSETDVLVEDN